MWCEFNWKDHRGNVGEMLGMEIKEIPKVGDEILVETSEDRHIGDVYRIIKCFSSGSKQEYYKVYFKI